MGLRKSIPKAAEIVLIFVIAQHNAICRWGWASEYGEEEEDWPWYHSLMNFILLNSWIVINDYDYEVRLKFNNKIIVQLIMYEYLLSVAEKIIDASVPTSISSKYY